MTQKSALRVTAVVGLVVALAGISAGSIVGPVVGFLGGGYAFYRSLRANDTKDLTL